MIESHSDFVLPGLAANRHGPATLIVMLVYAYSRRWNRRRLEHHTYAFWNKVLSYFVSDLEPYVFHIPQPAIHRPPQLDPNSSFRTDAGANGDETIPDFSIMGVTATNWLVNSNTQSPEFPLLEKWNSVKIQSVRPFVIAELKRTPSRSAPTVALFRDSLQTAMAAAKVDAENQASLAFEAFEGLDQVILMAAAGEWWSFRLATRDGIESDVLNILELEEKLPYRDPRNSKASKPRVKPFIRYTDLQDPYMAEVLRDDVEDAMPEDDEWSGHILFGTEISNQRFFLIHRWLEQQRGQVGDPYNSSESVETSDDEADLFA